MMWKKMIKSSNLKLLLKIILKILLKLKAVLKLKIKPKIISTAELNLNVKNVMKNLEIKQL